MKRFAILSVFLIFFSTITTVARGDVKLPHVFGDHMVLQRGQKIPVWGWADPGEKVTVTIEAQAQTTTADGKGKWRFTLNPIESSTPVEMHIEGKNSRTISDILIGDVWLCSGQSNMAFAVKQSNDGEKEVAQANFPQIRILHVNRVASEKPLDDVDAKWMVCSPETIGNFSAVGYFFGRHLNQKLNVPIGLIESAWGGTPAESWTDRKTLETVQSLANVLEEYRKQLADYPEAKKKYDVAMEKWRATTRESTPATRPSGPPREPIHENNAWSPSNLYNAMILPLQPFAIKGAIWYQGESNAGKHAQYAKLLSSMITGWRNSWNQPENHDFPFLIVQLANWVASSDPSKPSGWPELREAQAQVARNLPACGLAIAIDIGDSKDIHPKNKQEVGRRLGLVAEKQVYGRDVVASGPTMKSVKLEGDRVTVEFDNVAGGLIARGESLTGFEIAGADGKFYPAKAEYAVSTVTLRSDQVSLPTQARYGWADDPNCDLFNDAGLPAVPFRCDVSH